jgi:DNA-binding transcriptional LysR family regulator
MRRPTFDLDVLRTFVTGVECNSFAKAAERLGRSTSAVSAQLKKLEEHVGHPLLVKAGRGLVLTALGEALLSHARRLLALNDEVFASLQQTRQQGTVRLGLQEDFAEHLLSDILRRFTRIHPLVNLEVRIARNGELLSLIEGNRLDLALAWDSGVNTAYSTAIGRTALHWIGSREQPGAPTDQPLPLVLFEAPCVLRTLALHALDQAQQPWRIALTSPSVGGLWAAVAAGLGVTLRSRIGLPAHLQVLEHLPPLPSLGYVLHRGLEQPPAVVELLAELITDSLERQP